MLLLRSGLPVSSPKYFRLQGSHQKIIATVCLHIVGMSYIGGMLLMQLEEYDAFWCFVSLMERQKYLRGYYSANMSR